MPVRQEENNTPIYFSKLIHTGAVRLFAASRAIAPINAVNIFNALRKGRKL